MIKRLSKSVSYVYYNYPIVVNSLTYGSFFLSAEFIQQTLNKKWTGKKEPYDVGGLARCAFYGTCIGGPIFANWYKWLDGAYPGTAARTIVKKLVLDQCTITPAVLAIFYTSMSIMEGKDDIFAECRKKLLPTYATSCLFWVPAQLINFVFVPPSARILYISVCSITWANILVYLKRGGEPEKPKAILESKKLEEKKIKEAHNLQGDEDFEIENKKYE